jgi:hypothetical protein
MSNVKIVHSNVKEVLASMSGDRLGRAVMAGGFVLETAIKISMAASSHSGVKYGTHQASAAGETPAVDTGVYINSIQTQLAHSSPTDAIAEVGTNAVQANRLELGFMETDSLGRKYHQLPRPHFRPAYDNNLEKIKATIGRFAKQQIERATK